MFFVILPEQTKTGFKRTTIILIMRNEQSNSTSEQVITIGMNEKTSKW